MSRPGQPRDTSRPDELAMVLSWRRPNGGSYPRPDIPGFYLTMYFANEGVRHDIIEERLLTAREVEDLLGHVNAEFDGDLTEENIEFIANHAGEVLASQQRHLEAAIERSQQQLERIKNVRASV